MTVVVCTVPQNRFDFYRVTFPADWEIRFVVMPIPDDIIIQQCRGADFLLISPVHRISDRVINNSPSLRIIQIEGPNYDKVDIEAATRVSLPVCNNRREATESIAEFSVNLMLAGLRRTAHADQQIKDGQFEQCQKNYRFQGIHEMRSRKVGLIGCGPVGRTVARMLQAFRCRLFYYDRLPLTTSLEATLRLTKMGFDDLIATCDIISLHIPSSPQTINLINKERIELMKPSALIINTSEGAIINQSDLATALESGRIYGAALDTLTPEPPPPDHPLLNLTPAGRMRLTITPHVAGTTNEFFSRRLIGAVTNMVRVNRGKNPIDVVNGIVKARN